MEMRCFAPLVVRSSNISNYVIVL